MLRSIIMLSQASSVKDILENFKAFLLFSKLPVMVLQSVVQENTRCYQAAIYTLIPCLPVSVRMTMWRYSCIFEVAIPCTGHYLTRALHEPTNMANASIIAVRMFIFISFAFYGLTFSFAHFFCIHYFSVFPYIADTSRAVGVKEQCEHFAYKVGVDFTLPLRHAHTRHRYDSLCLCSTGGFYTTMLSRYSCIWGICRTRICGTLHNTAHRRLILSLLAVILFIFNVFNLYSFYHSHNIYRHELI